MTSSNRSFRSWYAQHGAELNEKRKTRYRTDPEYREQVLARAAEYRKTHPRKAASDRHKTRCYKGHCVPVFPIREAAEAIDRTMQVIRKWERNGLIPKPLWEGHRYYTMQQVQLMKQLATEMNLQIYEKQRLKTTIPQLVAFIHRHWQEV